MSQQAEGVLTIGDVLDSLVRSNTVISKDGYSCDGTDLQAFPNNEDNPPTGLNDEINTEAAPLSTFSAVGSLTLFEKNPDGTFTTAIQAPPSSSTNPLSTFGVRVQEIGDFVYDAPIVESTPFPEPAKIIDRKFEVDPTTLEITNTIELETIFDYDTDAVRDINSKVQVVTVPTETSIFNFFTNAGSNSFTVDSNGNFFVITALNEITKFDSSGLFVLSFNLNTTTYNKNSGMAVDSLDNVYVLSSKGDPSGFTRVEKFTNLGVFVTNRTIGSAGQPQSWGLGINSLDEVFALTYENPPNDSSITRLDTSLVIQDGPDDIAFGNVPNLSNSVVFDLNDDVYLLDFTDNDLIKIDRTNLSVLRRTGSSANNVITIGDNLILQTGDQYEIRDINNTTIGTFTQADGYPQVKGNFLYIHDGGFINKYAINFGTSTLEVLTRDSNSNFTSRITETLSTTIPETFATGPFNMRFAKVVLSNLSSDEYRAFFLIYENFNSTVPIVTSSDWSSTSNMTDGSLTSFDAEEATHLAATLQTILDFSTIEERDYSANVQVDIQSGTPTSSFDLEGSNDLTTFTPITSGSLTDGVLENIVSIDQNFRFIRITQATVDNINPFVVIHSLFEGWDNKIVNGLDFSTIVIGGSTSQDSTVNQSQPLTFLVSDADELFHPPRYFQVEENKFLTAGITIFRTGQVIKVDRGMTLLNNYA